MKIVEKGHVYSLQNKHEGSQTLTFFKDLPDNGPHHDGVLCQEVLRALIDRAIDLNTQVPCHENIEIINKLREVLILFETRAARRLMEKSYSKIGKHVEEVKTDDRGHILYYAK